MNDSSPADAHDAYSALRIADFRRYLAGNFLSILGLQMQTVAVGWEVYERTGLPFALAMVGLVQVLPVICLALLAGHVADRFNRRRVIMVTISTIGISSLGLAVVSFMQGPILLMYVCLFVSGVARAFQQPAKQSLVPLLVPRSRFTNAVTWNAGSFQLAAVLGPAISGGLIAAFRLPAIVFICDAAAAMTFVLLLAHIGHIHQAKTDSEFNLRNLTAGVKFVWNNKIILGASGLDMIAFLLGGAVALLPVYAKDILRVGPGGLGMMQAAPAIGAVCMSLLLSHRPPIERAGVALLSAVSVFGTATIVFGLSRNFGLSLAALFVVGASDMISVVVRQSLIQLLTPDAMRGRVSAINGLFISISNEVGAFESGTVAALAGPTFAVVSGGMGTLAVVAAAIWLFPQLRRYGRLDAASSLAEPSTMEALAPPPI